MHWFVFMLIFNTFTTTASRERDSTTWQPTFDEDDDIDPFEDEGEQIQYPMKSVVPERAMPKRESKVIKDNGSGLPSQGMPS